MPASSQANRLLKITTPLGPDAVLLVGLTGREAISELFSFELDLLVEQQTKVPFEKLLGKNVTIGLLLPAVRQQYFNGIINRFTQGGRDSSYTRYRAVMVPELWLWTKRVQSRIFQHLSIPDILKQVLTGLKVSYDLKRDYQPRDYCVQYRESDFDFASRLMEEEGIYYFFKHTESANELVVSDAPTEHPSVPGQKNVIFDELAGGNRDDMRITSWEKTQELRSGKYTLWDHCFELPDKNLAAERAILESVRVGEVTHTLRVDGNDKLEIYDYPGGYAQRFDGVDKGGSPQPAEVQKIFEDNKRTVAIRMEQEERDSVTIQGAGNCAHFSPGYQFTLERHFDANGAYLLTSVEHNARQSESYRSGEEEAGLEYDNTFTALPIALPYRPLQTTYKPTIAGVQTATVVGPPGEEIFIDKYGRVKVQFHWDRQGKRNVDSSCWIRVAQVWAGKRWGAFFWPRVGHEVVVIFEEGDPDQPLIIGSVYNAANMPPLDLPGHRMQGGFKSCIFSGNPGSHFNAVVFHDRPGEEYVHVHSEKHEMNNSETNHYQYVHQAQFHFHGDF